MHSNQGLYLINGMDKGLDHRLEDGMDEDGTCNGTVTSPLSSDVELHKLRPPAMCTESDLTTASSLRCWHLVSLDI